MTIFSKLGASLLSTLFQTLGSCLALILVSSCSAVVPGMLFDASTYGKVEFRSGTDFAFQVNDDYLLTHQSSKLDKENPHLTKAEANLLTKLLRKKGGCKREGKVLYKIYSRQDAVYDTTFLADQNLITDLRLKPSIPKTFFGKCVGRLD